MSLGSRTRTALFGVGLGAALMYLLDPAQGRRRRRRARTGLRSVLGEDARHAAAPVADALAGMHASDSSDVVPAEVLVARVRAAIGHTVSHPTSVAVGVDDRFIRLSGPIFTREASDLLRAVRRVAGSRVVEDRLHRYRWATVPPLRARGRAIWPRSWRLLSAGAGVALGAGGLVRRGATGAVLATTGGALILRAATNRPLTRYLAGALRAAPSGQPASTATSEASGAIESQITDVVVLVPLAH